VKELLQRSAIHLNRRRFLGGAAAATFAALAGASVARAPIAMAGGCTGPNGTGPCASVRCRSGRGCNSTSTVGCYKVTGFCPTGTPCWSSAGHTCCDCRCQIYSTGYSFYCYCHTA
jgi:hypothetical protein